MSTPEHEPQWERQLLERVAFAALNEQRARRRWGIFFKLAALGYFVAVLVLVVDWGAPEPLADGRHTAVIHLHGTIEAQGEASAQNITDALQQAFDDKGTAGVILRVNSPGGSPVQAGIVHDEIRRLRTKHPQIPLYAVVEDVCASGGYYVAVAADKIFVDKASIVGSIGVLMDAFGFTGAMEKLGIERRLLTAGENKGFLDPFSPQDARQKEHAQVMLREIHRQFIEVVRRGRGQRLKETPEMFSGLMWTGSQSIRLGLADGYGTVGSVARDVIKADRLVDFTIKENLAERFARRLRTGGPGGLADSLVSGLPLFH
ncbi:S49 family peptidase [Accumulibacter sp.]|uniref:S49 family peptidase n=1 Tax=Accumulibacter sp. TaxID=2053492 RepID=UPI0025CCF748|nr:S49 family peptidase [Accumulibacter sp.]MCM8596801.1 S49 family peptidase [Accumulibacter sp.]MCM8624665.1 S49 family peptidase [Accumulibacter sp.]MDS4050949.1 S49 family peptidase [Accumulibacter sp.]